MEHDLLVTAIVVIASGGSCLADDSCTSSPSSNFSVFFLRAFFIFIIRVIFSSPPFLAAERFLWPDENQRKMLNICFLHTRNAHKTNKGRHIKNKQLAFFTTPVGSVAMCLVGMFAIFFILWFFFLLLLLFSGLYFQQICAVVVLIISCICLCVSLKVLGGLTWVRARQSPWAG